MPALVLASGSPFRQKMLADAGLTVRLAPPDVDERRHRHADPAARARSIVHDKVSATVLSPGEVGIAADQVAYDPRHDLIFGKPDDDDQQLQRLVSLMGRTHHLYTAWVVFDAEGRKESGVERSDVTLRIVEEDEVRRYVESGEARGCAGGYAVEANGSFLIERIDGDWFNVVGLPLYAVYGALRTFGWSYDA